MTIKEQKKVEKIDLRKSNRLMYESFSNAGEFVLNTKSFVLKNGERVFLEFTLTKMYGRSLSIFADKNYNKYLVFGVLYGGTFFRTVVFIKDEDLENLFFSFLDGTRIRVSRIALIPEIQQEQYCSCVSGFSNYVQVIPVSGTYFNKKELKKDHTSVIGFFNKEWSFEIRLPYSMKKEDIIKLINYNKIIAMLKISMKYWERKKSKYPTESPLLDEKLGGLGLIIQKIINPTPLDVN